MKKKNTRERALFKRGGWKTSGRRLSPEKQRVFVLWCVTFYVLLVLLLAAYLVWLVGDYLQVW